MKIRSQLISLALILFSIACTATPDLEVLAYRRLPKTLERKMEEELSLTGGADIVSPETLYASDSLCIIQCKAVARDAKSDGYSFPVRYILVRDVVMSHAMRRPMYEEYLAGGVELTKEETKDLKARYKKESTRYYTYYAAVGEPVNPEDL